MNKRRLIHIAIGLFVCTTAFARIGISTAAPQPQVLPYYNADGYSTVHVYVNTTDATIELPSSDDGGRCGIGYYVCPSVAPHSFKTLASTKSGIGVESLPLPSGIEAYSEITTPHGVPVRIGPLTARATSYVPNVTKSGDYDGGVFVAAETDSVVQIVGGEAFKLKAGEGHLSPAPTSTAIVTNTWGGAGGYGITSGRLYVFGFINHYRTGAVLIVNAH